MIMEFTVTTVGDMISGFTDNMPDDQIDKELKLLDKIRRSLKVKKKDGDNVGVLLDKGRDVSDQMLFDIAIRLEYRPWVENNEASGYAFIYFRNPEDAEKAAAFLAPQFDY